MRPATVHASPTATGAAGKPSDTIETESRISDWAGADRDGVVSGAPEAENVRSYDEPSRLSNPHDLTSALAGAFMTSTASMTECAVYEPFPATLVMDDDVTSRSVT